jgi:hypothetical protein
MPPPGKPPPGGPPAPGTMIAERGNRILEGLRFDLEIQRECPGRRQYLCLTEEQHAARCIRAAVGFDRGQHLDRADPFVGEVVLPIKIGCVHLDVGLRGSVCHRRLSPLQYGPAQLRVKT